MEKPQAFMEKSNVQQPAAFNSAAKPALVVPAGCPFSADFKMGAVEENDQVPPTYRYTTPKATGVKSGTIHATEVEVVEPKTTTAPVDPPLGVLEHFKGNFVGTGFNMIFRPKNPQSLPPMAKETGVPAERDDNILELNLTTERLKFKKPLGDVPNRGLFGQVDISLNGVPYVQRINDVTNHNTGRADKEPTGIHFEPGMWIHVPATTIPKHPASLARMASIPHGTVINAQGLDPKDQDIFRGFVVPGGPRFDPLMDTTPFVINDPGTRIHFPSMDAEKDNTPRIPQDLSKFIETGLITSEIIKNPNLVLVKANEGKKFVETIVFTVSTSQRTVGEGISNIDFLEGHATEDHKANADASHMESIFWIMKVKHQIQLKPWKIGDPEMILTPIDTAPGVLAPRFKVCPDRPITAPRVIEVIATDRKSVV